MPFDDYFKVNHKFYLSLSDMKCINLSRFRERMENGIRANRSQLQTRNKPNILVFLAIFCIQIPIAFYYSNIIFQVAWVRAEDQTILSLHTKVVTHNSRISVTHDSQRTWQIRIRQLKESDRGCYMCQINTSVLKIQQGCIDVNGR